MATDCIARRPSVPSRIPSPARALRRGPRQFGWQRRPPQGGRRHAQSDGAAGRRPARCPGPGKVRHQLLEPLRQRVFGVACGYADCNDAARLADDPIHKLLVDRHPLTGAALGSQPTLSRFENAVRRAVVRLGRGPGRHGHRQPPAALSAPAGAATHDRPRSHRRSHPRAAGVRLLQRALRYLVLPAAHGHPDVQRRADAVPGGRGAAAGYRADRPRGDRPVAAPVRQAAPAFPPARLRVRLDGGFAG